jgi:hypothetical protein
MSRTSNSSCAAALASASTLTRARGLPGIELPGLRYQPALGLPD